MIGTNTVHFSMTTLNAAFMSELTPAGSGLPCFDCVTNWTSGREQESEYTVVKMKSI